MKVTTSLTLITLILFACTDPAPVNKETSDRHDVAQNEEVEVIHYPSDPKFNMLADFLSGVEGSDSSDLKSLESTAAWKNYRLQLDQIWKKTKGKIPVMREWAVSELKEANEEGGTLFYPFSGPDFLHANIFFPEYDTIVMMGLEPIGNFPDLSELDEDSLSVYLTDVKQSLYAILGFSFFRTVAMKDDFRSSLDGVLPIFLQFINQTGHELLYQEKVAILSDGQLTSDLTQAEKSAYIGNRYYYRKNGEEKVRILVYFSVNLQDSAYGSTAGLSTRKDLVSFISGLHPRSTYLKSASYLMHRPSFSIIRNLILDHSEFVLQDDSGIPVVYFDRNDWDLTFYGNYVQPIPMFRDRKQEDLKRIYEGDSIAVQTLPFGIGYQYQTGSSNLMKATRK